MNFIQNNLGLLLVMQAKPKSLEIVGRLSAVSNGLGFLFAKKGKRGCMS